MNYSLNALEYNRTQSAYIAQSILEATYGEVNAPILESINSSGGSKLASNLEDTQYVKLDNIIIQPNPVGNLAMVVIPDNAVSESYQMIITNLLGQTVITKEVKAGSKIIEFNTSDLVHAWYFVKLTGSNGKRFSSKFIK